MSVNSCRSQNTNGCSLKAGTRPGLPACGNTLTLLLACPKESRLHGGARNLTYTYNPQHTSVAKGTRHSQVSAENHSHVLLIQTAATSLTSRQWKRLVYITRITCLQGNYLSDRFNPRLVSVSTQLTDQPASAAAAMCSEGTQVNRKLIKLQVTSQSAANLILILCKIKFELFGEIMLWF